VSAVVAQLLRPLIDQELSVVFYDLTTLRAEGLTELPGDLRAHGLAKEGVIARQCLLGVVQTAEGLPLAHRLWRGNAAETATLATAVSEVLRLYPVQRLILVADRGLLSMDNLAMLQGLRVGGGADARPLEYIVAVPARRYNEFAQLLAPVQPACEASAVEVIGELPWTGAQDDAPTLRLVWAHDPQRAVEQSAERQARIDALLERAQTKADKLDAQDSGQTFKGRKLSDAGAKARLFHEAIDARLGRIIEVDLRHEQLSWSLNEGRLAQARLLDGKLLLLTNVADLAPAEIVRRYKGLADIERGFHVLKSQIEITPMFHRLPDRIRAHGLICFLALVLHRVMRMRLKATGHTASPERALEMLRQVQRHRIHLGDDHTVTGLSSVSAAQAELFTALEVPRPTAAGL
jgi:transposase